MPRLSELYAKRLEARRRQVERNLRDMAALLDRTQKEVLGTAYPPASKPGEAPARRTGRLQREAGVKVNLQTGSIQLTNTAPYARHLKKTRPWQDITLTRVRSQLEALERRGMPFGGSE